MAPSQPSQARHTPTRALKQCGGRYAKPELIQAIGRGRAVNRTADNPLKIDIVTNYPLPIVVDELTTWALIQPTDVEIMRSRGAVPTTYRDMATAYPDLFTSEDAARKSLTRESALDINGFTSFGGQRLKSLTL